MERANEAVSALDTSAYSAIWTVANSDDVIKDVDDQFTSWLRGKLNWDPPTERSGYYRGPGGADLMVVHRTAADGRSLRLRLTESKRTEIWRTSVMVGEGHGSDAWVQIRVSNNAEIPAKVPRLAAYLLDALELRDGETWLTASPQMASGTQVEQIAAEVTDFSRQGLYFVAGTDQARSFDAFAAQVARWTVDTRGMAQVVVLDPVATAEFREILGESHAVPPWTIRTYQTEVDPAVEADARRHRILGRKRLDGSRASVRAILGQVARRHAALRPLPPRYAAASRALSRLEDQLLVDALIVAPSVTSKPPRETPALPQAPDGMEPDVEVASAAFKAEPIELRPVYAVDQQAAQYLAQVELVKEMLGLDVVDSSSLTEIVRQVEQNAATAEAIDRVTAELTERREVIAQLELERDGLRSLSDNQELDLADSLAVQAKLADEVRWLRRRLAEQGDTEGGFGLLPVESTTTYPADFGELADKLAELASDGVLFTGDLEVVAELTAHDPLGRVAGVAWDCLLALTDYIRARDTGDCSTGIRQYLEQTPQGFRSVPRKKFAAKETKSTMQAWGDLRDFPVPHSVNPAGTAAMEAHFKLGKVGLVSPRMYYLDNVARDGKVYVGYIGAHLRNTQTN